MYVIWSNLQYESWSKQSLLPSTALFAYHKRDVHSLFPQGRRLDVNRLDSTCQCKTAVEQQQVHPDEKMCIHFYMKQAFQSYLYVQLHLRI